MRKLQDPAAKERMPKRGTEFKSASSLEVMDIIVPQVLKWERDDWREFNETKGTYNPRPRWYFEDIKYTYRIIDIRKYEETLYDCDRGHGFTLDRLNYQGIDAVNEQDGTRDLWLPTDALVEVRI